MSRDPSAPIELRPYKIPRSECGFALEDSGDAHCGQPPLCRFRMKDWPDWRFGVACPEHAMTVRHWTGVEWMRSMEAAP